MTEIVLCVIAGVLGAAGGYGIYTLGVLSERMRHYAWLRDGWDLCIQHLDWMRLTHQPHDDWREQHLLYMTDVFGSERPYPLKKKEKVEK